MSRGNLRTTFLVDGFNVYHSLTQASKDMQGASTRWLDLKGLLSSCLPIIDRQARLEEIYYFIALALQRDAQDPGTTKRHRAYIDCLRASGVITELGRFKYKDVWCEDCRKKQGHYEEKETDVAISVKLIELFHNDACDVAVLVSGDTDLAPAVRAANRLFPSKLVCFAFPYKRKNEELAKLVPRSFRIKKERYASFQFPDPVVLAGGRGISKPPHW